MDGFKLNNFNQVTAEQPPPEGAIPADSLSQESSVPTETPGAFKMSPYTQQLLGHVGNDTEPTYKPAQQPMAADYNQGRVETEAGIPEQFVGPMETTKLLPRKTLLNYLGKYNAGANLAGMADTPLQTAYTMARLAQQQGYHMQITSGKRDGGGKSYHDHGEAIDARLYKQDGKGGFVEMLPSEEVEAGKKIGKQAGWASMLDEINFNPSGQKTGPHLHFSHGNELGLMGDPSHHMLNKRYWTDKGYLDPIVSSQEAREALAAGHELQPSNGLPQLAETIARGQGVNPQVFVRQMQAESNFNPDAVSPVGAKGISQFMPDTLSWFARKHGIDPASFDNNPNVQMKMGAMYLRELTEQFGGNYARGLAAYNSGPGTVDSFVNGKGTLPEETKNYVFKILHDLDPSIATVDQAAEAIRSGIGPKMGDQEKTEVIKKQVLDAQVDGLGMINYLLGTGAYAPDKLGNAQMLDEKNPVNASNQMQLLFKEILQDATFGLSNPLIANLGGADWLRGTESTQAARDELLQQGSVADRALAIGGFAGPRAMAMAASGSFLMRGLKMLPGIGGMLNGVTKGAPVVSEGEGIMSKIQTLFGGGPLEVLKNTTLEHGVVGGLMMGQMAGSDYLWESFKKNEPVDMGEYTQRVLTSAAFGGVLSTGLAIMMPASLGLGGSFVSRILGTPETNSAAAGVFKKLNEMGYIQRAVGGAIIGGTVGGTLGGAAHVTGADQAILGQDTSLLGGIAAGGAAGFGAAWLKNGLDWAGISKAMANSPVMQMAQEHMRKAIQFVPTQLQNMMTKQVIAEIGELNTQRLHTTADAARDLIHSHIDQTSSGLQEQANKMGQFIQKKTQDFQKVQSEITTYSKLIGQMDQQFPEVAQAYKARQIADQQLQKVIQTAGPQPNQQQMKIIQTLQDRIDQTDEQMAKAKDPTLARTYASYKELQERRQTTYGQKLQPALQEYQQAMQVVAPLQETLTQTAERLQLKKEEVNALIETAKNTGSWEMTFPEATSPMEFDPRGDTVSQGKYQQAVWDMYNGQINQAIKDAAWSRNTVDKFERDAVQRLVGDYVRASIPSGQSPHEIAQNHINNVKEKIAKLEKEEADLGRPPLTKNSKVIKAELEDSPIKWALRGDKGDAFLHSSAPKLKGKTLAAADADLVYNQAISAGVDVKEIDRLADEFGSKLLTSRDNVIPPTWDGAPSAQVAAVAKLAIQHGDSKMPFYTEQAKPIGEALKEVKKANWNEQITDLKKDLDTVKSASSRWLQDQVVSTLDRTEIDPETGLSKRVARTDDNPFVQGGTLNALTDPNKLLKDVQKRAQSLSQIVKSQKLLPQELLQPMDALLNSGKVGDVGGSEAFLLKAGVEGDKVQGFVKDINTALAIAEMRRLQYFSLNDELRAKPKAGQDKVVVSALREKYAAEIPDAMPSEVKSAIEHILGNKVDSTFGVDFKEMSLFNKQIAEITNGTVNPLERAYGLSFSGWHDLLVNRVNAMRHVREEILRPNWEKLMNPLKEQFKDLQNPAGLSKFHREMVDALEDYTHMEGLKKKYGAAINPLLDFTYNVRSIIEKVKSNSPELIDYAKTSYFPHKFGRMAAHLAAINDGNEFKLTADLASEKLNRFRSLRDVERAVEGVEGELKNKGIDPDSFLNMSTEERLNRTYGPEVVKNMNEETRRKATEKNRDMATTLLFKDPVTDPLQIMSMQLESMTKASGLRKFFGGLANVKVDNGFGQQLGLVEVGPVEKASKAVKMLDSRGKVKEDRYVQLSSLPKFNGLRFTMPDGNSYTADQILLHPHVRSVLSDYVGSGTEKIPGKYSRIWGKFMKAVRNHTLMGSILPHMHNMHDALAADFINTPWKLMNVAGAGSKILAADITPGAAAANAARHGLNLKTIENNNFVMANLLMEDFGPEMRAKILGVGDGNVANFLTSLDPTDPRRFEARKALGATGGFFSDVLGVPQALDYAMNRDGLFKFIEAGQFAGFHFRVADLMKSDPNLAKIADPELRLKYATMAAADVTNRLAGALPQAWAADGFRKTLFKFGLTPQWWLSKAATIVDAFDAATSLAGKKMGGSGKGIMEYLANRKPFEQYPEGVRDTIRKRLMYTVAGQLGASFMALQAAQYMMNQSFTFHHPPDKWFHLHYNGNYYNNVMGQGYVRELFKFVEDSKIAGGKFEVGNALMKLAGQQLTVDPEMLINVAQGNAKVTSQQAGVPLMTRALDYADYMIKEGVPSLHEAFGLGDNAKLTEMLGIRGNLSPTEKEARMLTSRQFLLRQVGAWESKENFPRNLQGELSARNRDIESQQRQQVMMMFEKARLATNGDERNRYVQAAYRVWGKGTEVADKDLRKWYPGGVYRMSDKAFQNLFAQAFNPTYAAMMQGRNTPVGMELMTQLNQAGNMDDPIQVVGDDQ